MELYLFLRISLQLSLPLPALSNTVIHQFLPTPDCWELSGPWEVLSLPRKGAPDIPVTRTWFSRHSGDVLTAGFFFSNGLFQP